MKCTNVVTVVVVVVVNVVVVVDVVVVGLGVDAVVFHLYQNNASAASSSRLSGANVCRS